MTARALLNAVEVMIVESVGREEYDVMLHGEPHIDRALAIVAMGGEVA